MRYLPLLFLLCASCFQTSDGPLLHTASGTKQKQRIGWLKKKREIAERDKKKIETEVERLNDEIHQTTLSLIQRQLDDYEKQVEALVANPQKTAQLRTLEIGSLFLQERESLHEIIQDGPSPSAFSAQNELDRILRMITQLSEKQENQESQGQAEQVR